MTRYALVVTYTDNDNIAVQEIPARHAVQFVERFVSAFVPSSRRVWRCVEIPDDINGRDVTRYAETVGRS